MEPSQSDRLLAELLDKLDTAAFNLDAQQGRELLAARYALMAVIDYLRKDKAIEVRLLNPLRVLDVALHDLCQGAKPDLFFDKPKPVNGGAPTNHYRTMPRALIAVLFDVMIKGGEKNSAAKAWLVTEAKAAGLKMDIKRVEDWRETISDTSAPELMRSAFAGFLQAYMEADPGLKHTKENAKAGIVNLAQQGF
ncbi:hypothetical protein HN018_19595 [Lichenicola cladoniae]|uniref:Uncharacterized protein n=1 Tax=Lichenicola cladoniae TaxID=1484109 RepID=A0A6M8HTV3_9PROT|nr:hypothetical protein [Lichenicola cladoniae]NPD66066.1 hypothetical protein [Acetobacteraceae bacterium]QKE91943.1 hypothetical protein HN018_19595 [Lichenicola cladoniae]